jgi:hypothetical protein
VHHKMFRCWKERRRRQIPMLWELVPGSEIAFIVQAVGCKYRYPGSCLQGVCGRTRIHFDQSQYAAAFIHHSG